VSTAEIRFFESFFWKMVAEKKEKKTPGTKTPPGACLPKKKLKKTRIWPWVTAAAFVAGGLAGQLSWLTVIPFDGAKSAVQASWSSGVAGSFAPVFRRIASERGARGLYAGIGPALVRLPRQRCALRGLRGHEGRRGAVVAPPPHARSRRRGGVRLAKGAVPGA